MKSILKACAVAFSMYSKIPMPRFVWGSQDMKYHLCFFPLVGAVIGGIVFLWNHVCTLIPVSDILKTFLAIAVPLIITGGFHVDGFMDTMDAIHSYQDREKKLEILKDPHIGAFSVICVIVFFLFAIGFSFEIKTFETLFTVCASFVISRELSGLSVLLFPKAKKDGMASVESKTDGKKTVVVVLLIELFASCTTLLCLTLGKSLCGIFSIAAMGLSFVYYYFMSRKNFGGITGDLAGFFICISELTALIATAVSCIFGV